MTYFFWHMSVQLETPFRQDNVVDMVTNSGLVVQSVLYLLMSFSVISWGIVLYKFRQIRQARGELMRLTRLRKQPNPGEGEANTEEGGIENVERAMRRAIRQQITHLERALTFLATTASTAPFVGLFGTVWGIMDAFRGLSHTMSSSIQAVAPGIAEALIATAIGLAAAIPSVMAFNYFSRQIRVLSAEMENFSAEFLNIAERHFL